MPTRLPAVANRFYPGDPDEIRRMLAECLPTDPAVSDLPDRLIGGIVPHAGWVFSGRVAGEVFAVLGRGRAADPATVVLFGAPHRVGVQKAAVYDRGAWRTPLGDAAIDEDLARRVCEACEQAAAAPFAHEGEHSIEVQVPFVQTRWPDARILPINVMPDVHASVVGEAVAGVVEAGGDDVVFVGSTDLTHYGPSFYGFTPKGSGPEGLRWAKQVNDRGVIERMLAMDAEGALAHARQHHSACGGGAIAAAIAACKRLGATRGVLLKHTTSAEVGAGGPSSDAVGYAGIVFG